VGSYGGDPWLTGLVGTALYLTRSAQRLQAKARSYLRMTAQQDGSWHMIHGMAVERIEVTGPAYVATSLAEAGYAADEHLVLARQAGAAGRAVPVQHGGGRAHPDRRRHARIGTGDRPRDPVAAAQPERGRIVRRPLASGWRARDLGGAARAGQGGSRRPSRCE